MALLGSTKITDLTLLDGVIGDLVPITTNVYDLGTSSLKWRNIYATTFVGAISGTASNAVVSGRVNVSSTDNAIARFDGTSGAL